MKRNDNSDRPLLERLEALAAFLPKFEAPDFVFGELIQPPEKEPGVKVIPHYDYSPTTLSLFNAAYEWGWVSPSIDWMSWGNTEEAQQLIEDRDRLARASADELTHLLTMIIRLDRFTWGGISSFYESGLLTAILRRAATLAEELRGETA